MNKLCREPRHGERGAVIIEFYWVAILLMVLAFGMIEFSNMLSFQRRVSMSSQVLVDLIARSNDPQNADVTELENAVRLTMKPFSADVVVSVAHLPFDENGDPLTRSSDGYFTVSVAGSHEFDATKVASKAQGLSVGNDAVLVGRVSATYKPLLFSEEKSVWFPFLNELRFDIDAVNYQRPRPSGG